MNKAVADGRPRDLSCEFHVSLIEKETVSIYTNIYIYTYVIAGRNIIKTTILYCFVWYSSFMEKGI
jgi:hypothetical protein